RPADAQPGGEGLGEGSEVHDTFVVDRPHRGGRRLIEVQQPVRVVFEHQNARVARDLQYLDTTLAREGHAGRVLETGDRVQELDAPSLGTNPLDRLAERLRVHAVFIHRHVDDLCLE